MEPGHRERVGSASLPTATDPATSGAATATSGAATATDPAGSTRDPGAEPPIETESATYETWDGSTTGESFPDLTTPATYSFARRFYRAAYRDLARLRGMPSEHLDAYDCVFGGILGYLRGRIYLRDRSWAAYEEALRDLAGSARPEPDLDAHLPEYLEYLAQARLAHLQGLDGLELGDIVDLYHGLENALFHRAGLTVATDMRVIRVFTEVTEAMAAAGIDPEGPEGTLLFAQDNLAGAAGTQFLMALAARIRGDAALCAGLAGEPRAVLERLVEDPALGEIRSGLEAYLGSYGHRGPGEMLLERPMPIDRPDLVVAQIQALVAAPAQHSGSDRPDGPARPEGPVRPERPARPEGPVRPEGPARPKAPARPEGPVRPEGPARPKAPARVERKLAAARTWIGWRERMRASRAGVFDAARQCLREIGARLADLGVLDAAGDVWFLSVEEVLDYCEGYGLQEDLRAIVALRRREFEAWRADPPPDTLCSDAPASRPMSRWAPEMTAESDGYDPAEAAAEGPPAGGRDGPAPVRDGPAAGRDWPAAGRDGPAPGRVLRGVVAWPGRVEGVARVLRDPGELGGLGGDILVANRTDPGWTPLFPTASAIVVEHGNPLCHAAILARELRIPTMVGVPGLLAAVKNGDRILVDANAGEIRVLAGSTETPAD